MHTLFASGYAQISKVPRNKIHGPVVSRLQLVQCIPVVLSGTGVVVSFVVVRPCEKDSDCSVVDTVVG